MPTLSRLHFSCMVLSPFLSACSTAQCFPSFRVVRFYLEDWWHRCCGRGWSTRSSACSIRCSRAISTGSCSAFRKWLLESLPAMLSCARRASRRGRTRRLFCEQELKLLASFHHEKLGRDASEPSSISGCDRTPLYAALLLRHSPWSTLPRF